MGKRKPPRRIRDKEPQPPKPVKESTLVKSHRRLWIILGGIATLLTIVEFYLGYVLPKLSVDVAGSVQPSSPMGTVFYLSNDGTLPIHDVAVTMGNIDMRGQSFSVSSFGAELSPAPQAKAEILSAGHKMTLPYAPAIGFTAISNFTGGRIVLRVHYRPDYLPWHKTEIFPFEAIRTVNGNWIWRSVAM